MKATDFLMQEHKLILRALDVLDEISNLVEENQSVDQRDIDAVLEFLRWFADAHHQAKEESVLFPVVIQAATVHNRSVEHMTVEHNQERALVEGIEKDLRLARHAQFVAGARRLSSTLRNHIYKEDRILFESVDAVLSPQQDDAVFEGLAHFETALDAQAKQRLCTAEFQAPASSPRPRIAADWAEEEFGNAQLGHERLRKRLLKIARDFYARPQAQIPQACQSRAATKAAYRFFQHPETTMDALLKPHIEATQQRIGKEKIVLAVQDTTSLNYSTHPATHDLGPIGSSPDGIVGLIVHDTMAFSLEGTPLGLVDVQCWARNGDEFGKKHQRKQRPIEQKESYKWLHSYRKTAELQLQCPNTTLVSVGDREADIYELFHLALEHPRGPKLLVRAEQDRLLADGQGHLCSAVEQQPRAGIQQLQVPRRGNRPARQAQLEIRFSQVTLNPPKGKASYGSLTLWAVWAQEIEAPPSVEPLRWMLLTTCRVDSFDAAIEKLSWYTKRWCIEIFHRTLKSGCKIEERQLGSAIRIEACLAIDMVVAWRVYHLTKLGREVPDVPCTIFFEEAEWMALTAFITKNPIPPAQPPRLRDAIRMVASLGGFLGRKGDGEPGTKSLWLGLQRLDDITATAKIFSPYLRPPPVSSASSYG